ncbi:agglutinin-like isoform X2 [Benincasa hispida]|uniref:agglutinin-like isoform X2 n=1 Tax=Benincasa hispida TaxID=102211 RepID=UPI001900ED3F|nr:agglutinin-like isoform X2 [Benincasa hispida]XP_038898658.1 agglutinin-like isoform X2 [Benincasa hispida]
MGLKGGVFGMTEFMRESNGLRLFMTTNGSAVFVSSILIKMGKQNGVSFMANRPDTDTVTIQLNSDFLTSIHGYTEYSSIKSLTFETISGRTYGPYGDQEGKGTKFSIPLRAAKIVGFHGRSDEHSLNAIGVYVQPITKSMRQLHLQLQPQPEPEPEPEPEPQPQPEECFSLGEYGLEDGEY